MYDYYYSACLGSPAHHLFYDLSIGLNGNIEPVWHYTLRKLSTKHHNSQQHHNMGGVVVERVD